MRYHQWNQLSAWCTELSDFELKKCNWQSRRGTCLIWAKALSYMGEGFAPCTKFLCGQSQRWRNFFQWIAQGESIPNRPSESTSMLASSCFVGTSTVFSWNQDVIVLFVISLFGCLFNIYLHACRTWVFEQMVLLCKWHTKRENNVLSKKENSREMLLLQWC